MSFAFETKAYSLGELFSGPHIFRVPSFQRPFAWTDDSVAQLFDDIQAACERSDQSYFLGPIIAANTNINRPFEIIDGQQRLVSVTLFIAALRDLISDKNFSESLQGNLWREENPASRWTSEPRIRLRDCDQKYYEHLIRTPYSTRTPQISSTQNNLAASVVRIRDDIQSSDIYLMNLATYLLNSCHILLINTKNIDDGYTLFCSINTSGQPLTDLDIARGHVIAADPALAKIWDEISAAISEDELRGYIYSVVTYVDPDLDGLNLNVAIRDILHKPLLADQFRKSLTALLKAYDRVSEGDLGFESGGQRINRILRYLKALPFENWKPLALSWLTRAPDAVKTLHFLRALDVLFTGMVVLGCVSNTIKERCKKIRIRIEDGTALTDLKSEIYLTDIEKDKIRERLRSPINPRAKFLRYIMLRLNAEMLDSTINTDVKVDVEIEHVLPQKPSPKSLWLSNFEDKKRRVLLCQLLGNLAILSKPINIRARNFDFHKKRQQIFNMQHSNTFPITANLIQYDEWTEKDILHRHERLLEVVERIMNPQIMPS